MQGMERGTMDPDPSNAPPNVSAGTDQDLVLHLGCLGVCSPCGDDSGGSGVGHCSRVLPPRFGLKLRTRAMSSLRTLLRRRP